MNAGLYLQKAILQLDRGQNERAEESLKLAIETAGDDMLSIAQARCVLGEYYFVSHRYLESREHFMWILDNSEELQCDYDDLLDEEINRASVLLDTMKRFSLGKE